MERLLPIIYYVSGAVSTYFIYRWLEHKEPTVLKVTLGKEDTYTMNVDYHSVFLEKYGEELLDQHSKELVLHVADLMAGTYKLKD